MFIKTIEPDEATGEIAALYDDEVKSMGRVLQATQCWSARPDVIVPIEKLLHRIRDGFSLGLLNFRLITFVTARYVPSSYCSHVYFAPCPECSAESRPWRCEGTIGMPGLARSRSRCLPTPSRSPETHRR